MRKTLYFKLKRLCGRKEGEILPFWFLLIKALFFPREGFKAVSKRIWQNLKTVGNLYLALFHLSDRQVCEFSRGMGNLDLHEHCDSTREKAWKLSLHTCKRCGKKFSI